MLSITIFPFDLMIANFCCGRNQARLQRNLMYLAAIADSQPQPSSMHSQVIMSIFWFCYCPILVESMNFGPFIWFWMTLTLSFSFLNDGVKIFTYHLLYVTNQCLLSKVTCTYLLIDLIVKIWSDRLQYNDWCQLWLVNPICLSIVS